MGQKTNPIGNRLGYIRGWESNWYGGNDFGEKLAEDDKIRKYLKVRLTKASISRIAQLLFTLPDLELLLVKVVRKWKP